MTSFPSFSGSLGGEGLGTGLDIFFSIYFMSTGLHGIHVVIGMLLIGFITYRAMKGHYSENHFTGVEMVGLYWHIVDIIWIFLFPLLYLSNH